MSSCSWKVLYGIPTEFVSDKGPQYASKKFNGFYQTLEYQSYNKQPILPSGKWTMVQTIKGLLTKSDDVHLASSYQLTPLTYL